MSFGRRKSPIRLRYIAGLLLLAITFAVGANVGQSMQAAASPQCAWAIHTIDAINAQREARIEPAAGDKP